ncbi:hypothetical protein HELRODRAFT_166504 [Helobdella robusta]|uniref:AD domain-containing protein n=1 Tax=Helobdella robusta TaxID=6412 RepID=T1EY68_HELRO|nr:hypothetical protein HELRODRAFT_166504 [Helobdella robusta]ESO11501.1 hypothetical protein HELRODRAFT_166504 [Helobdella robusta]
MAYEILEPSKLASKIGSIVRCTDFLGTQFQGEVVAYDEAVMKCVVLKMPASNKKPNLFNFTLVNLSFQTKIELVKEATMENLNSTFPNVSSNKLDARVQMNGEEKMKRADFIKPGSSILAQSLISTISKTIEEVRWSGDDIIVWNKIVIKPPYKPDCCFKVKDSDSQSEALTHVNKIVAKFHEDLEKYKFNQTSSSVL